MKSKIILLVLGSSMLAHTSCKKSTLTQDSQLKSRSLSSGNLANSVYSSNLIMTEQGFLDVLNDISSTPAALQLITNTVSNPAKAALSVVPSPVSSLTDSQTSAKVKADGDRIYKTALQSFLFQNSDSSGIYRDKARDILLAWVNANNVATTHTPNESIYQGFYEGYSLIRAFIDTDSKTAIDNWFRKKYIVFKNTASRANNWETIRGWLMLNIGYTLNDPAYITESKNVIYTHFDKDTRVDGASVDFLGRDAFAYHAYNLAFIGRILRIIDIHNGRIESSGLIYKRVTKWNSEVTGGTIAEQIKFWTPYIVDPANNVHLEFVNTEWAPDKTRSDYNKPYNAAGTYYALDQMVYAMKNQINAIYSIAAPNRTKYNSGLDYYLNSFGFTPEELSGTQVYLYADENYLKLGKALSPGNYTMTQLQALGITNDAISSVGVPDGMKITLYEHNNFTGASISLTKHSPILSAVGFNDKASSIKVEKL